MKIGVVITSNDVEKSWNALRFMNVALESGHEVSAFLMNGGVECEFMDHELFNIAHHLNIYLEKGGKLFSCGTCLQFRKLNEKPLKSEMVTMIKLLEITEESDKLLTF